MTSAGRPRGGNVAPRGVRRTWQTLSGNRSRQVVGCAAAAAQILLPTLLGPRFTEDEQPPNVIQPAPYTFGVWLPIFAASAGYAGRQASPAAGQSDVARRIGWPLAAAFASTGVWAPLVRTGKYWSAQTALAAIAAFAELARRRLAESAPEIGDRAFVITSRVTAGMLSAWGLSAAGVNLAAMLVAKGLVPAGRASTKAGVGLLVGLGAAGAAGRAATVDADPTVSKIYAATLLWGLTGVAVGQRKKSPPAAIAAVAAMVPVALAATPRARRPLA